jgi:predicted PurR-regulated permease PerM
VLGGVLGAFLAVPVTAILSATIPIARGREPEEVVEPEGEVTSAPAP